MALLHRLVCLAVLLGAMFVTVTAHAAGAAFSGGTFSCLDFTNGLGDNSAGKMQSSIARIWVQGYITGYYKDQDMLTFSDAPADAQAIDDLLVSKCRELPQASILTIALKAIAAEPHKVPTVASGDFKPATYTCGQHLEAKGGPASKAIGADLAELWAFAFIQGYKNVVQPDVEIKPEFRDPLINALMKACAGSKDALFLDYAALVAQKVKIAP